MLTREAEFGEQDLPLVALCVLSDSKKCPPNFTAITKAFDDGSDADLWKDSFGFGIFNRVLRYIAVSRVSPDEGATHMVITDMAIISEKEAVPTNFVCIDYTADSKERALKKKFICIRFTPRNDALDALTDIIVLNKTKKTPKGYTSCGEIDGAVICFRAQTIPEGYGVKQRPPTLYPSLDPTHHNILHQPPDLSACTIRAGNQPVRGLDGVEFRLSPRLAAAVSAPARSHEQKPELPDAYDFNYNFSLERSIMSS